MSGRCDGLSPGISASATDPTWPASARRQETGRAVVAPLLDVELDVVQENTEAGGMRPYWQPLQNKSSLAPLAATASLVVMTTLRVRLAFRQAWPCLVVAGAGMVVNVLVAALFGISPVDVLLLRYDAAVFQVADYGVLLFGVVRFVECLARAKPADRRRERPEASVTETPGNIGDTLVCRPRILCRRASA